MSKLIPSALLVFAMACSSKPQRVSAIMCGVEGGAVEKDAWEPRQCAQSVQSFIEKNPGATVESVAIAVQGGYATAIVLYRGEVRR